LRTFSFVGSEKYQLNRLRREEKKMLRWLRLAEAASRVHIVSTLVKVAAKTARFLFHSNIGLIGLSALAARFGL
jgi:hypothetical protein